MAESTFNTELKLRDSNMELLRLVAQFVIVLYHLFLIYVEPYSENTFYKAIQIPLHIGVILFVLISGYFGIRATSKGFLRLISMFTVFSIPEIVFSVQDAVNVKDIGKSLLFFSHTHFWFIRTYVFLYLMSPVINKFLVDISDRQRIYLLASLFFICIYVGTTKGDAALTNGKNVLNFIFLYVLGDTLRKKYCLFERFGKLLLFASFFLLNGMLVVSYCYFSNSTIGKVIWHISFPYSSPVLILSSVLFFLIFVKIKIKSGIINYFAKSSLAIYLIHANRPLFINVVADEYPKGVLGIFMSRIIELENNPILMISMMLALTIAIILIAIAIDKMLTPLWNFLNGRFDRLYHKIGF